MCGTNGWFAYLYFDFREDSFEADMTNGSMLRQFLRKAQGDYTGARFVSSVSEAHLTITKALRCRKDSSQNYGCQTSLVVVVDSELLLFVELLPLVVAFFFAFVVVPPAFFFLRGRLRLRLRL